MTDRERAITALRAWVKSWEADSEYQGAGYLPGAARGEPDDCTFDEKLIDAIVAEFGWRAIETLPEVSVSAKGEPLILAKTEDGRRMIYRPSILRSAMRADTPSHLRFPAVAWMEVPE